MRTLRPSHFLVAEREEAPNLRLFLEFMVTGKIIEDYVFFYMIV